MVSALKIKLLLQAILSDIYKYESKQLSLQFWLWFESPKTMVQTYYLNLLTKRTHSPLGEVSLYSSSPVLQVWIELVHYIHVRDVRKKEG